MSDTLALLKAHRSIRKFEDRPIAEDLFRDILESGQCAATSSFLQGVTIMRVRDAGKRARIAELAGNQPYVEKAAEFLVFCADLNRPGRYCERYEKPFSGDFTEQFIIATVDAALMAQNVAVAAESAGLGICYIGGIRNNPRQVSDLLELPKGVYPVFGFCMGYPAQDPETKPRLPLDVILKEDVYSEAGEDEQIAEYDERVREYYRTRTGGGHGIAWSEQVSTLLSEKSRPHMREFLAEQGFTMQ